MVEMKGQRTWREITDQSQALAAALDQLERQQDWIDQYIGNPVFDEIVFIGSGSSYYQALVMAACCRTWAGRNAVAYPSSEIYLFREQCVPPGKNVLLVGVSRSGESTEVLLALESVRELDHWTLCGITCHENSPMARLADCLVSPFGKEESTVMTKSFSSMTFMMQAAIATAVKNEQLVRNLSEVAGQAHTAVTQADPAMQQLAAKREYTNYIYLGMGAYDGLVREACLKIKEMANVWTESFGTLEFRHGPKSIVVSGTLLVLLLSERARAHELKVAQEMKQYGATVLILTAEQGDDTSFADHVLEVGGQALGDEARSVLYLPALQYLGYYVALQKNVDPDSPRNLTQVVKL